VQKNRTPEAYVTLKRIARSNKRPMPETYDAFVLGQQKNVKKQNICNDIKVVQVNIKIKFKFIFSIRVEIIFDFFRLDS
jgi:hypothetical protein